MMNVDILWSNFLSQIKEEMTSLSYNTWFSETELYKLENGKAYIIVPMPIHKKHLMDNFSQLMIDKISSITGSTYELELLLKEEIDTVIPKEEVKIEQEAEKFSKKCAKYARKILDMIKNGEIYYDFIEVMACDGGCIAGGGGPKVNRVTNGNKNKRSFSFY